MALRACAFLPGAATMHPVSQPQDNFRNDDVMRYVSLAAANGESCQSAEILHFDEIVVAAKRRHKAFFEKLGIG